MAEGTIQYARQQANPSFWDKVGNKINQVIDYFAAGWDELTSKKFW